MPPSRTRLLFQARGLVVARVKISGGKQKTPARSNWNSKNEVIDE